MKAEDYMHIALKLAKKGCGRVNPNPMVGAVIVKNGRIIGKGFHEEYGKAHAERNALADCRESPQGAALYVTLEPCCHYGRTPPCTQAILESGITKVYAGSVDPNPLMEGKGFEILRSSGVRVYQGILREECDRLNEVFFHYMKTGLPFVVMKYAMTMDGRSATRTGESKWITSEQARRNVHADRGRYSAIMTGVNTVIADDPLLTCRTEGGRNPIRIICDTNLRTPLAARLVQTSKEITTYIATSCAEEETMLPYREAGCRFLPVSREDNHVDLKELMKVLGAKGIDSILLEGGARLNASALQSRIVNRVQSYIAPKLFGGSEAKGPVGGYGVGHPDRAIRLSDSRITLFGEDILIESEVIYDVYGAH